MLLLDEYSGQQVFGILVLYICLGPPRIILLLLHSWYPSTITKKRNALYARVGVPCAGVITHRQFEKDGSLLFRYAYRPPNDRNTVYIRDFIREPKNQPYPWDDDRLLVVLVVPGHNASGLEVRKVVEPIESYWIRFLISALVSLFLLLKVMDGSDYLCLFPFSLPFTYCFVDSFSDVSESDHIYQKFDVNRPSHSPTGWPLASDGDGGQTTPTNIQDLSRPEIAPALERAEARILRYLQSLSTFDRGSLDKDIQRFYARSNCVWVPDRADDPRDDDESISIVEATAVVANASSKETEEAGDLEMAAGTVEKMPLLEAETVGDDYKKKHP